MAQSQQLIAVSTNIFKVFLMAADVGRPFPFLEANVNDEIWAGSKVKADLRYLGIEQQSVSRATGMKEPALSKWINGRSKPRRKRALKVQTALLVAREKHAASGEFKPN